MSHTTPWRSTNTILYILGLQISIYISYRFFQESVLCFVTFKVASLVIQLVKNLPAIRETWIWSLGWEIPWRRERLPTPMFFPGEFHRLYGPWGCKESDTTERLLLNLSMFLTHFVVNNFKIDDGNIFFLKQKGIQLNF